MSRLYHVHHPEQARAKWTVKNHLRRGKLIKPDHCERCEKPFPPERLEGHHWSYKKEHHGDPIWLCKDYKGQIGCHRIVHNELGKDWVDAETKPNYRLSQVPECMNPPTSASFDLGDPIF